MLESVKGHQVLGLCSCVRAYLCLFYWFSMKFNYQSSHFYIVYMYVLTLNSMQMFLLFLLQYW